MARIKITIEADDMEEFARKFWHEMGRFTEEVKEPKLQVLNKNLSCKECGSPAVEKKGISKNGKAYHGIFCISSSEHTKWL